MPQRKRTVPIASPSPQRWLHEAQAAAWLSPHPSVRVGAVVTTPDGRNRLGRAANAPPDGIRLTAERQKHGEKSLWVMCAEKRALAAAQRRRDHFGLKSLKGCRIYSTLEPCHTCAHDIIEAGIKLICVPAGARAAYPKLKKKYRRSMAAAETMFAEAGVKLVRLPLNAERALDKRKKSSGKRSVHSGKSTPLAAPAPRAPKPRARQ